MLGVVNYEFLNLEKFQEHLEEFESYTYDFEFLEELKEGKLSADVENIKLAEGNLQKLIYSFVQLAALEAPLMEALNLINEVKKNTLNRVIGYQDFFLERSLDSLD